MRPVLHVIEASRAHRLKCITSVNSKISDVVVTAAAESADVVIHVVFHHVIGFRCLDERELTDLYGVEQGIHPGQWLYRVEAGGWFDLERTRGVLGFLENMPELVEYVVADRITCVNVLALALPVIEVRQQAG